MPKMRVVIEVDQEVWDQIPAVARYLNLPSDVPSPATVQAIFEHATLEYLFEATGGLPAIAEQKAQEAISAVLDPNVSVPLKELAAWVNEDPIGKGSLIEEFEDLLKKYPTDQWMLKVLAMPEAEQPQWKAATAAVYSVVYGVERKTMDAWNLIERTYGLLEKKP